jgi:hypothetical protein
LPLNGSLEVSPAASTYYGFNIADPASNQSLCWPVVVTAPRPPSIAFFRATPPTIRSGESASLSAQGDNATSANIDNGKGNVTVYALVAQPGQPLLFAQFYGPSQPLVTPSMTTTYTLTARNGSFGTTTATTTITVIPFQTSILSFAATPQTIRFGDKATLSWSTTRASGVVIDNGVGPVPYVGSKLVSPAATTIFTLTTGGSPNGTETAKATVTVTDSPEPAIASFVASPRQISDGGSATLSWSTVHGTTADIDNGVGTVPTNGSIAVRPTKTTVYALWVNGAGGTKTRTVTVFVGVKKPPDIGTLAGSGGLPGAADGIGRTARFRNPWSIAMDAGGNTIVADSGNNTVRKITPAGVVTTIAGAAGVAGSTDGKGIDARFDFEFFGGGVAADRAGNLYVGDTGNNTIRKIGRDGMVSTLAGSATDPPDSTDGQGRAARFNGPSHLAVDGRGVVYVADTSNHTIRKITPDGVVTTLAGSAGARGFVDGIGSVARFNIPHGMAVDPGGNVYVGDIANDAIRKITPDGRVTTLAGGANTAGKISTADTPTARFSFGCCGGGLAVDQESQLYVADRGSQTIRTVSPTGDVSTLAGSGGKGSDDGTAAEATFNNPIAVAIDGSGTVVIADTDNHSIRTTQTPNARRRAIKHYYNALIHRFKRNAL